MAGDAMKTAQADPCTDEFNQTGWPVDYRPTVGLLKGEHACSVQKGCLATRRLGVIERLRDVA